MGDVTVNIFLRELYGIWEKAETQPTHLVVLAAKKLGIVEEECANIKEHLKSFWLKNGVVGKTSQILRRRCLELARTFAGKRNASFVLLGLNAETLWRLNISYDFNWTFARKL